MCVCIGVDMCMYVCDEAVLTRLEAHAEEGMPLMCVCVCMCMYVCVCMCVCVCTCGCIRGCELACVCLSLSFGV